MSEEEYDSDTVLQELFAAGKIKPGLNYPVEKKAFVNNVDGLRSKLKTITNILQWSERLDVITELAPIAPELSVDMTEKEQSVQSGRSDSIALNEFKRETQFHRQAQAAVMEAISRLRSHGIPTTRPDDYFAEMMKSDEHMQKVRQSLLQRQSGLERSEKVKKMRAEKKLAKQKQIESKLRKQNEKKELSDQIKKYRKGTLKDLDFLNNKPKKENLNKNFRSNKKRDIKDKKYGFGGKKRGMKKNQFTGNHNNNKMGPGKSGTKKNQFTGKNHKMRPGKSKRKNKKNK